MENNDQISKRSREDKPRKRTRRSKSSSSERSVEPRRLHSRSRKHSAKRKKAVKPATAATAVQVGEWIIEQDFTHQQQVHPLVENGHNQQQRLPEQPLSERQSTPAPAGVTAVSGAPQSSQTPATCGLPELPTPQDVSGNATSVPGMTEERLVTEVPSSLKQLARLVVRGFYTIEDALIVDMLVRNPCMKEDDICELLKFERKMLRARISTLKNDKFIQVRLKMETGLDGKAQKVNYYFINYKTFVNVVKYKLDLMRKRMETEERDATSRASFKCPACGKTFTDLEADQLYDMMTQEFRCTFCSQVVEEDQSALPKKDSRLLLAKYNEQLEPLYQLLRAVEGIKLAPEILEPEPVDINTIRGLNTKQPLPRGGGEQWSGEATRGAGLAVEETRVDVTVGEQPRAAPARKERPVWMVESTVTTTEQSEAAAADAALEKAASAAAAKGAARAADDIMSVLLAHEKQTTDNSAANALKAEPDSSDDSDADSRDPFRLKSDPATVAEMESSSSESEDGAPCVLVAGQRVAITAVDDAVIARMSPAEKEAYIQQYQDYYSHIYD